MSSETLKFLKNATHLAVLCKNNTRHFLQSHSQQQNLDERQTVGPLKREVKQSRHKPN